MSSDYTFAHDHHDYSWTQGSNHHLFSVFLTAKERYRYRNEIEQKDLCVAALIKNGADLDYQNSKGEYALLIAGKT